MSAILYIWSHAEDLNIDPEKTVLSGFRRGGGTCVGPRASDFKKKLRNWRDRVRRRWEGR